MPKSIVITEKEFYFLLERINEDGLTSEVNHIFQTWQDRFRDTSYSNYTTARAQKAFDGYTRNVLEDTQALRMRMEEKMPDGSPRFRRLTEEEAESCYIELTKEQIAEFLGSE